MSEWQPIKTAPKHGKGLIYFEDIEHVEDASFYEDEDGGWMYALFDGWQLNSCPTHWMPLPEPPKPEKDDE